LLPAISPGFWKFFSGIIKLSKPAIEPYLVDSVFPTAALSSLTS